MPFVNPTTQAALRDQYLNDLHEVLDAEVGQRALYAILASLGTFAATSTGEQTHVTAAQAGRANAGRDLLKDCFDAAPHQAGMMITQGMMTAKRLEEENLYYDPDT